MSKRVADKHRSVNHYRWTDLHARRGTDGPQDPSHKGASCPSNRAGRAVRPRHRRGLSLLEVMLAMAILGGCVAAIGELVRLGARHAEEVRLLTTAQLLCEGKMEEIEAGITAPESVSSAPFELDPDWMYSVTVTSIDDMGLMEVRVTVEQVEATRMQPLTFSLIRWMLDPAVEEMSEETYEPTESTDQTTGGGQEVSSDASP